MTHERANDKNEAPLIMLEPPRGETIHPISGTALGEIFPPEMTTPRLNDQEIAAALPEVLAAIAALMPLADVLKLSEHYGGTRVYVPSKPTESSELVQLIGLRSAQALARIYGGDSVEIPKSDALRRAIRNRELVEGNTMMGNPCVH